MNAQLEQAQRTLQAMGVSAQVAQQEMQNLMRVGAASGINLQGIESVASSLARVHITGYQAEQAVRDFTTASLALGLGQKGVEQFSQIWEQMAVQPAAAWSQIQQLDRMGVPALESLASAWGMSTLAMRGALEQGIVPSNVAMRILQQTMEQPTYQRLADEARRSTPVLIESLHTMFDENVVMRFGKGFDQWLNPQLRRLQDFFQSPAGEEFFQRVQRAGSRIGEFLSGLADRISGIYSTITDPSMANMDLWSRLTTTFDSWWQREGHQKAVEIAGKLGGTLGDIGSEFVVVIANAIDALVGDQKVGGAAVDAGSSIGGKFVSEFAAAIERNSDKIKDAVGRALQDAFSAWWNARPGGPGSTGGGGAPGVGPGGIGPSGGDLMSAGIWAGGTALAAGLITRRIPGAGLLLRGGGRALGWGIPRLAGGIAGLFRGGGGAAAAAGVEEAVASAAPPAGQAVGSIAPELEQLAAGVGLRSGGQLALGQLGRFGGGAIRLLGRAAIPLQIAAIGAEALTAENENQRNRALLSGGLGIAGGVAGGVLGGLTSFGLGAPIGAVAGGVGGQMFGSWLADKIWGPEQEHNVAHAAELQKDNTEAVQMSTDLYGHLQRETLPALTFQFDTLTEQLNQANNALARGGGGSMAAGTGGGGSAARVAGDLTDQARSDILSAAESQLNKQYSFGSAAGRTDFSVNPSAFDCSGLVAWAYERATGTVLPAFTESLAKSLNEIPESEAKPGDVVLFNMDTGDPHQEHAALYRGGGQIVEAGGVGKGVNITNVHGNAALANPHFYRLPSAGGGAAGTGPGPGAAATSGGGTAASGADYWANRTAEVARQFNIDAFLFSRQIAQESAGFASDVISGSRKSSAGAGGIGQFMPGTAAEAASLIGVSLDQFWADPDLQLQGSAALMKHYLDLYGGDWNKALVAYNAGPGRVGSASLPEETSRYLWNITGGGATPYWGTRAQQTAKTGGMWSLPPLSHQLGGVIPEPVVGRGLSSNRLYSIAERGPERISPLAGGGVAAGLTINGLSVTINASGADLQNPRVFAVQLVDAVAGEMARRQNSILDNMVGSVG